jgi:hypothetical protein
MIVKLWVFFGRTFSEETYILSEIIKKELDEELENCLAGPSQLKILSLSYRTRFSTVIPFCISSISFILSFIYIIWSMSVLAIDIKCNTY